MVAGVWIAVGLDQFVLEERVPFAGVAGFRRCTFSSPAWEHPSSWPASRGGLKVHRSLFQVYPGWVALSSSSSASVRPVSFATSRKG